MPARRTSELHDRSEGTRLVASVAAAVGVRKVVVVTVDELHTNESRVACSNHRYVPSIAHQLTCCGASQSRRPVWSARSPSTAAAAEKAQHEPHAPWSRTGVTAPADTQSTLDGRTGMARPPPPLCTADEANWATAAASSTVAVAARCESGARGFSPPVYRAINSADVRSEKRLSPAEGKRRGSETQAVSPAEGKHTFAVGFLSTVIA